MALTSLGGMPWVPVGHAGLNPGTTLLGGVTSVTLDAVNEAAFFIGQLFWEDAGSHTVDTTGSSSIQWRSSSATFANAGTTVIVGLAAVDGAAGPPARPVNSSDVVTFDVSRSLTGGGGGIANGGWNTTVPTSGTKTVAHADFIAMAVQMTARGGADTIAVSGGNHQSGTQALRPCVSSFVGAAYAAVAALPNAIIIASDGTLGLFFGAPVFNVVNTVAFNSGSAPNERGNLITLPVPGKVHGILYSLNIGSNAADFDLVLYSDPLGTPAAEKTVSVDANTVGAVTTANIYGTALFTSPYTFTAGQALAAIFKPTTANSVTPTYVTLASSAHMKAYSLGTAAYAVNRSSGAFGVQNSNLDRYQIGLLIESFDNGAGGAGGGGIRLAGGGGLAG